MNWNKLKKQLESFLSPKVIERVAYSPSGYRYTSDKKAQCYILVDKREALNMRESTLNIKWYQNEQEARTDTDVIYSITPESIEQIRQQNSGQIPDERLVVMAQKQQQNRYAKQVMDAQSQLHKSEFTKVALAYLSSSVDECLESDDILLNIFALLDRRVGKKRIVSIGEAYKFKHPVVRYFYALRINS